MMNNRKRIYDIIIIGTAALVSCLLYLIYCYSIEGWGFPLDDSWIHHTFARNFAENLKWVFNKGELSGGSTGPVWGLLLSLVYFLGIPPIIGTYFMGFLLLWGLSVSGADLIAKIFPGRRFVSLGAGIMLASEWHLVWSALSGMETILLILISLFLFNLIVSEEKKWLLIGLLIGLAIWIRPDGITLLGPALYSIPFKNRTPRNIIKSTLLILAGVLFLGILYFAFNLHVAGDLWPNTFYAKQAEYAYLQETPFLTRFLDLSKQSLVGVGILLLPGLIIYVVMIINQRRWDILSPLIWAVGYIGLYAWRLPVVYQHGRYIMPALPVIYLMGAAGLGHILLEINPREWKKIIMRTWLLSSIIVAAAFLILGARAFGMDVAVINTEMVRTAKWIDLNLEEDAVIAAHDIGALGYYSERKIIDLAGLISSDVIPFIRDEKSIKNYLAEKEPDYLMSFPSWYPEMTADLIEVYKTKGKYSPLFGMDNMSIYSWE